MGRDRELKWLAFSLYPLSFFLYSPFKGFPFTITLRQRPKGVPWGQQWIKRQRERMRITPLCFAKIQYLYIHSAHIGNIRFLNGTSSTSNYLYQNPYRKIYKRPQKKYIQEFWQVWQKISYFCDTGKLN